MQKVTIYTLKGETRIFEVSATFAILAKTKKLERDHRFKFTSTKQERIQLQVQTEHITQEKIKDLQDDPITKDLIEYRKMMDSLGDLEYINLGEGFDDFLCAGPDVMNEYYRAITGEKDFNFVEEISPVAGRRLVDAFLLSYQSLLKKSRQEAKAMEKSAPLPTNS